MQQELIQVFTTKHTHQIQSMKNQKARKIAIQTWVSQIQITITTNMMIEVLIIQNQATPDLVIPILVTLDQNIVLHPGQVHHPQ